MHFMVLILIFLVGAVLWGFFHSNPQGVPRIPLALVNVVILAAALVAGALIGSVLYADAVSVKAGEKGMATYLAIMAAGRLLAIGEPAEIKAQARGREDDAAPEPSMEDAFIRLITAGDDLKAAA